MPAGIKLWTHTSTSHLCYKPERERMWEMNQLTLHILKPDQYHHQGGRFRIYLTTLTSQVTLQPAAQPIIWWEELPFISVQTPPKTGQSTKAIQPSSWKTTVLSITKTTKRNSTVEEPEDLRFWVRLMLTWPYKFNFEIQGDFNFEIQYVLNMYFIIKLIWFDSWTTHASMCSRTQLVNSNWLPSFIQNRFTIHSIVRWH